jgi:hypothetical protein
MANVGRPDGVGSGGGASGGGPAKPRLSYFDRLKTWNTLPETEFPALKAMLRKISQAAEINNLGKFIPAGEEAVARQLITDIKIGKPGQSDTLIVEHCDRILAKLPEVLPDEAIFGVPTAPGGAAAEPVVAPDRTRLGLSPEEGTSAYAEVHRDDHPGIPMAGDATNAAFAMEPPTIPPAVVLAPARPAVPGTPIIRPPVAPPPPPPVPAAVAAVPFFVPAHIAGARPDHRLPLPGLAPGSPPPVLDNPAAPAPYIPAAPAPARPAAHAPVVLTDDEIRARETRIDALVSGLKLDALDIQKIKDLFKLATFVEGAIAVITLVGSKNKVIEAIRAELGTKDARITALVQEVKDEQARVDTAQERFLKKHDECLALQTQIEALNQTIDQLQRNLLLKEHTFKKAWKSTGKELSALTNRRDTLQRELNILRAAHRELRSRLAPVIPDNIKLYGTPEEIIAELQQIAIGNREIKEDQVADLIIAIGRLAKKHKDNTDLGVAAMGAILWLTQFQASGTEEGILA